MNLKKINPDLQKALIEAGLTEPTELQQESFGPVKSGADFVFGAVKEEGKTTTIVINVIQKLEKAHMMSPRALIFVKDKAKVLEILDIFKVLGKYTDLRVYGVHEKTNLDEDKNQISVGIDVLVGTPTRLNEMFSTAGFDVNQLKVFIVDDAEELLRERHESKIARISDSIAKIQRLFFTDVISERVEILADRLMVEPMLYEMGGDDDDEYDIEEDLFEEEDVEFEDFDVEEKQDTEDEFNEDEDGLDEEAEEEKHD